MRSSSWIWFLVLLFPNKRNLSPDRRELRDEQHCIQTVLPLLCPIKGIKKKSYFAQLNFDVLYFAQLNFDVFYLKARDPLVRFGLTKLNNSLLQIQQPPNIVTTNLLLNLPISAPASDLTPVGKKTMECKFASEPKEVFLMWSSASCLKAPSSHHDLQHQFW